MTDHRAAPSSVIMLHIMVHITPNYMWHATLGPLQWLTTNRTTSAEEERAGIPQVNVNIASDPRTL